MKYLLDTDHLSILQRKAGQDYTNLSTRMAQYALSDFAVSIVTFQEQMLGSHTYINRANNLEQLVKGYERIQLGKMDARIAAIALCRGLILLTCNHRDFSKVSGLLIEDWTV